MRPASLQRPATANGFRPHDVTLTYARLSTAYMAVARHPVRFLAWTSPLFLHAGVPAATQVPCAVSHASSDPAA
jgi:hypothetical protein